MEMGARRWRKTALDNWPVAMILMQLRRPGSLEDELQPRETIMPEPARRLVTGRDDRCRSILLSPEPVTASACPGPALWRCATSATIGATTDPRPRSSPWYPPMRWPANDFPEGSLIRLSNRIGLVTGSSRGIGAALAIRLEA